MISKYYFKEKKIIKDSLKEWQKITRNLNDISIVFYRSTLDIDTNNKEVVSKILLKISNCINFDILKIFESRCKGFHIELFCNIKCDICRMVYDDSTRFYYDSYRPEFARNILFDKTEEITE